MIPDEYLKPVVDPGLIKCLGAGTGLHFGFLGYQKTFEPTLSCQGSLESHANDTSQSVCCICLLKLLQMKTIR